MAAVVSRLPQQPLPIDRGNPLSKGLVFAAYPIGNGLFYDAVSGKIASSNGGAVASAPLVLHAAGPALTPIMQRGSGSDYLIFPGQTGMDRIAGPLTVFVEGSLVSNAAQQSLFQTGESGAGDGFGFRFDDVSAVTNGFWLTNFTANAVPTGFDALGANSEQFTHRCAISIDGVNARFFAQNALFETKAYTTLPVANANRRMRIFGDYTASNFTAAASLILGYDRALSLGEYQALYANPYQVLSRRRRGAFKKAAAGTSDGVGASAGVGTATGVGASNAAAVGASAGTGAATGVGAGIAAAVGAAAGTGTATGVGSGAAGSDGAASGTGTAMGVGASTAAAVGASAGDGAASGVGASTAAAVGASTGTGAAAGVGAGTAAAVGSAAGTSTAPGIGQALAAGSGVGDAAGTSTVTGVGASIAAAVGSASGTGTADGIATGTGTGGSTSTNTAVPGGGRRQVRLTARINGELVTGPYDVIMQMIHEQARVQARKVPSEVSNLKTRKAARKVARQTAPTVTIESIQQPAGAEPINVGEINAMFQKVAFNEYASQLAQAMVAQRKLINEQNEIAIKNATDLLL